jgi:hypothetical protein
MSIREIAKDQETPLFGYDWSAGIGQPAGLFWLEGRCIVAGLDTRAEAYLITRGAVPVGRLHFGRDPAEGTVPRAHVAPVAAARLAAASDFGGN